MGVRMGGLYQTLAGLLPPVFDQGSLSGMQSTPVGISQAPSPATKTPDPSDYMAQANPKGLVEQGNLPIWTRPTVQNADGSHSTEYSISNQDDQGHEVLIPTVVNGKFLTPDGTKPAEGSPAEAAMFHQAWSHYEKTGEHLGKFDTPANADAYAGVLHNRGTRPK
jgi:hypothetical protein